MPQRSIDHSLKPTEQFTYAETVYQADGTTPMVWTGWSGRGRMQKKGTASPGYGGGNNADGCDIIVNLGAAGVMTITTAYDVTGALGEAQFDYDVFVQNGDTPFCLWSGVITVGKRIA